MQSRWWTSHEYGDRRLHEGHEDHGDHRDYIDDHGGHHDDHDDHVEMVILKTVVTKMPWMMMVAMKRDKVSFSFLQVQPR